MSDMIICGILILTIAETTILLGSLKKKLRKSSHIEFALNLQ